MRDHGLKSSTFKVDRSGSFCYLCRGFMLNPALFAVLCCPKCRGPLVETAATTDEAQAALACTACQLRYAITDGIPNLLIDEAQTLDARP